MRIRLATFNVENLFDRPVAMNFLKWSKGQPILDAYNKLNTLLNKEVYTEADKQDILKLLKTYGLLAAKSENRYFWLRKSKGQLVRTPKNKPPEIVANGRSDWVGWIELRTEAIDDQAIKNTARVIAEVNPDILVLVEIENRPTLQHFYDQILFPMLQEKGYKSYCYNMVIDGNDSRGIDVGILSRMPIVRMRSHIDDSSNGKTIFSRDCPEYYVELGNGSELIVLPNHFASKGSDIDGKRRKVQSNQVKKIYQGLKAGHGLIVVAGDLNDHPAGGSLDALVKETDLKDAMSLDVYKGHPGTYRHANANEKLDYLLLSPSLASAVVSVDVERRGFYAPTKWPSFENITEKTKDRFQASDHHCLWADIDL